MADTDLRCHTRTLRCPIHSQLSILRKATSLSRFQRPSYLTGQPRTLSRLSKTRLSIATMAACLEPLDSRHGPRAPYARSLVRGYSVHVSAEAQGLPEYVHDASVHGLEVRRLLRNHSDLDFCDRSWRENNSLSFSHLTLANYLKGSLAGARPGGQ